MGWSACTLRPLSLAVSRSRSIACRCFFLFSSLLSCKIKGPKFAHQYASSLSKASLKQLVDARCDAPRQRAWNYSLISLVTIWLQIHTSTCAKSSSSSSVIPALTSDNKEDVLEPATDATEDKPDRQSSSSSSGGRSSHRNGFPSESLEHKDSNNLEKINKGFKKAQQQRCILPLEPEADVRFQKPRQRGRALRGLDL